MSDWSGEEAFVQADIAAEIELLKQATGEGEPRKDDPAPLFVGMLSGGKIGVSVGGEG